jgi:hypothetical protein
MVSSVGAPEGERSVREWGMVWWMVLVDFSLIVV